MADVVPISGGPEQAKIRHVLAPLGLGLITLGIYNVVWWYKVNRELADLGRKNGRTDLGTSPITSVVAITIGWIIIVPAVLSIINTWKRLKLAQELVGLNETEQGNGVIYGLLMVFVSIAAYCYFQSEINKVWQRQPGAGLNTTSAPTFTTTATETSAASIPATESGLPGVPGGGTEPPSPTNLPGIPGN